MSHPKSTRRQFLKTSAGIGAAVDYLIAQQQQRGGPQIEFTHDVDVQRFAPPLESAVFRIVQESLTNAARHSQSNKVRVELVQLEDCLRLRVEDWGIGFELNKVEDNRFGLRGIRTRGDSSLNFHLSVFEYRNITSCFRAKSFFGVPPME